jgi:hypothetical protein
MILVPALEVEEDPGAGEDPEDAEVYPHCCFGPIISITHHLRPVTVWMQGAPCPAAIAREEFRLCTVSADPAKMPRTYIRPNHNTLWLTHVGRSRPAPTAITTHPTPAQNRVRKIFGINSLLLGVLAQNGHHPTLMAYSRAITATGPKTMPAAWRGSTGNPTTPTPHPTTTDPVSNVQVRTPASRTVNGVILRVSTR